MSQISPMGRKAIEQARRGEFEQALRTAKEALSQDPQDMGLRLFAGLLHSRRFEFEQAAVELRHALALAPEDPVVRTELVRVLTASGQLEEAERLLEKPGLPQQESRRLQAELEARRGNHGRAAGLYRDVLRNDPRDFESWGNLGVSLLATGDSAGAVSSIQQSLQIKPGQTKLLEKLAEAHSAAGSAEDGLRMLYSQAANDPSMLIAASRLEDLQERPDKAMDALQRVLDKDATNSAALLALADLQERGNRLDELESTLEQLQQHAPSADKLPLLRARAAYRRGELDRALHLAQQSRPDVDPAARAQLLGQIYDRLGNVSAAFEAFTEMNRIDALATDPSGKADQYLATLQDRSEVLRPEWVARWSAPLMPPAREPAFLVGFPRSGTTLLDTLLMNDPGIAVSEENPMLTNLSKQIGALERIADLEPGDVERLRELYYVQAEKYVPEARERLLLDKFPFALTAGPLIHRLFPTSPIVFLCRHPCDVVLSCFMTRFQPTEIGSAFLSLAATARLYNSMMEFWAKSCDLLPLRVHTASYESLVEEPKTELSSVAEFLGIEWSDQLADNRAAAERRGFIKTPSYSQVGEPIYRRAVERWRKYSEQLRPVVPILQPWIDKFGYEA